MRTSFGILILIGLTLQLHAQIQTNFSGGKKTSRIMQLIKSLKKKQKEEISADSLVLDSQSSLLKKGDWQSEVFNSPEFREASASLTPEEAEILKQNVSAYYPLPEGQSMDAAIDSELKRIDEIKWLQTQGQPDLNLDALNAEAPQMESIPTNQKDLMSKLTSLALKSIAATDKWTAAMQSINTYKKKYSKLTSLQDSENAVRKNSLKNEPLRKRIVFGGDFNIRGEGPAEVSFEHFISYRINRKFQLGNTLKMKGSYKTRNDWPLIESYSQGEYSVGAFSEYETFRQISLRAEYNYWFESTSTLGLGLVKEFNLGGNLRSRITFLYEFSSLSQPDKGELVFKAGLSRKK